jgi:hypothetical protein
MLESGTFYDKSLDVAYAEQVGAQKLDAARKIVGSRINNVPPSDHSDENNNAARLAKEKVAVHEKLEVAVEHTECEKQGENGIQLPNENRMPKKRGRPRKAASTRQH